jgi:hypothetical protein
MKRDQSQVFLKSPLLSQYFLKYRGRKASDPRTEVFAPLSITGFKSSPFLLIDYPLSVKQVHVNLFGHGAATSADLNILCPVG